MIMNIDLLQVLLQVRLICVSVPNLFRYQDVSNEDLRTRETEYVTAAREMGPPHASEEKVHEHDGGYYVKIPECLSGERLREAERRKRNRPFAKWSRP